MSAGRWDLHIDQGSTYYRLFTFLNSDNTPFNLTDWTGSGQIRRTHRSSDVVATIIVDKVVPNTDGKFSLNIDADITKDIPAGETETDLRSKYVYDIELVNGVTGEVKRILQGDVFVNP